MNPDTNGPADNSGLQGIRRLRVLAILVCALSAALGLLVGGSEPITGGAIGGLAFIMVSLKITELAVLGRIERSYARVLRLGAAVIFVVLLVVIVRVV